MQCLQYVTDELLTDNSHIYTKYDNILRSVASTREQVFFVTRVFDQSTEEAVWVLQEVGRGVVFHLLSGIQHEDTIILDDGCWQGQYVIAI
jgi:adenosyl cobinamide kinase/adenosyl cobinamide phosphate guanylyltransferase